MTTSVPQGENPLTVESANDENALPTVLSSPKQSKDSGMPPPISPTNSQTIPLSPSKILSVDTNNSNGVLSKRDSRDDQTLGSDSLAISSGSSDDIEIEFVDRYTASLESRGSSDSESLERMMAKFDDAQAPTFEEDGEDNVVKAPPAPDGQEPETPAALHTMMDKFDLLQQKSVDNPDQNQMQNSKMDTVKECEEDNVAPEDIYRDNHLFDVLSPSSQDGGEGIEVQESKSNAHNVFCSYSTSSNDNDDGGVLADIEQFRSADSHLDGEDQLASASMEANISNSIDPNTKKAFENRIVALMEQVSTLEIEKDELRTQKDDLQSQLRVQHDQDVEDMYQNPYSDPFGTPQKSGSGGNPFLESAKSNLSNAPISMAQPSFDSNKTEDLHRELTELRMKNQSLQSDLETSDRVKERLKKVLATVQEETKQKMDLIQLQQKELDESKEREDALKTELNACKVRLEGFEMAQQTPRENPDDEKTPRSSRRSSSNKKSFFPSKIPTPKATQTGDVATALVVSQRQNEALEAFNKELEQQNTSLQKKCDALNEKYGLKAPAGGDDKGNQLYSRYLEMKSELTTLSVTLEEAQDNNVQLNDRVKELETKLEENKGKSPKEPEGEFDEDAFESLKSILSKEESSGKNAINEEQQAALTSLVEKVEVQIVNYREAEHRHDTIRAELETSVDSLTREAAGLRKELEESVAQKTGASINTGIAATPELEACLEKLQYKITTDTSMKLKSELKSLKSAMDGAADESKNLLTQLENRLLLLRAELKTERSKFQELETKHKALLKISSTVDGDNSSISQRLLGENERLNVSLTSLQKQTKQLKTDLEQKSIKVEKSEKRVAAKHEQLRQLTDANTMLREGIQKLKGHLSTISEQASQTEVALATTKEQLSVEREMKQQLEVTNTTLKAKLKVLQQSIDGSTDSDSSRRIELTASLAATKKELSLEKGRVRQLLDAKKELEHALDNSKDDLQVRSHTVKNNNSDFESKVASLERELQGTKLIIAAASIRMATLETASKENSNTNTILESTRELLTAEKAKTHQFEELEKLYATTQEELNEEEAKVEALEKQNDDLMEMIEKLGKSKTDLENSLDDAKQELQSVTTKNTDLESLLRKALGDDDVVDDDGAPVKSSSTDIRLWEAEMLLGNKARDLEDALRQNESLTGKVSNLESSLEKSQQTNDQTLKECETHFQVNKEMAQKIETLEKKSKTLEAEKNNLMTRMAALARRDQLQKASLATSNDEVMKLMKTMSDFQERFESLAAQVEKGENEKTAVLKEHEEGEAKWTSEKADLNDQLKQMQRKFDAIKKIDSKPAGGSHYPITQCNSNQTLMNQKAGEFEQDMLLLEVTLEDKKQELIAATVELEETKEKLEECEKELESVRAENEKMKEIEEELETVKKFAAETEEELKKQCAEKLAEAEDKMAAYLKTAFKQQQQIQRKYEACLEELEASKTVLKEKEGVMRELAKKQIEEREGQGEPDAGRSKMALELLTDELNEAHIRENLLEEMVENYKGQLEESQKKFEAFEEQVSEKKFGAGVHNDSLKSKIAKLEEETDALKKSKKALQKEIETLRHENEVSRVVAGSSNTGKSSTGSAREEEFERENLMMKDLLASSQFSVKEAKNMQKVLSSQVEKATKREAKLNKEILTLKSKNEKMAKRLQDQEQELDEFESDFALARNDARKVVEELRNQLTSLEKRNKQLEKATGGVASMEDLKSKLKLLVMKNKKLQKEVDNCKVRERRLEQELGLEPKRCG